MWFLKYKQQGDRQPFEISTDDFGLGIMKMWIHIKQYSVPGSIFSSLSLSLILDSNVFRTYKSGRHHFDFKFVGVLFSELSINKLCDLKNVDQIHDIMRAHRWFVFFDCTARRSKLPWFFPVFSFTGHWSVFQVFFAISLMDTRLIYDRNAIFTFCQKEKKWSRIERQVFWNVRNLLKFEEKSIA